MASDQDPLTVVITQRVKAGCAPAYEAWLAEYQAAIRGLPGYLGWTVQRPAPGGPLEYINVLRFGSLDSLRAYENSEARQRFLARLAQYIEADPVWTRMTGLEFWFTPPAGTVVPQPSRLRMALLLFAVVFVLVLVIGNAVNALFAMLPVRIPYALRLMVTIAIEVGLMTYWLMPMLTRRLARWIYPTQRVVE